MFVHKSRFLLLICVIILMSTSSVKSQTLVFDQTQVDIAFNQDDVLSSTLEVTLTNLPVSGDFVFRIVYGNNYSDNFTSSGQLNLDSNLIATTSSWTLVLTVQNHDYTIHTQTMEPGVYLHMIHVYANWTAGQPPPPDRRGLGIGALLDMKLLHSLVPQTTSNVTETAILAEEILNMLLDKQIDRNGDGIVEEISDGFGTLEYIYGMRDHITNAGNSVDATAEIKALATEINANISSSVIDSGNYGTFLTNLNQSDAYAAQLYRNATQLLSANLTEANSILTNLDNLVDKEILPLLTYNFNNFRTFVDGVKLSINKTFNLDVSSSSSSEESLQSASNTASLSFFFVSSFVVSVIVLKKRDKEVYR